MKKTNLSKNLFRFVCVTCIIIFGVIAIIGSAGPQYHWNAFPAAKSNEHLQIILTPIITDTGCKAFYLRITNKTNKDIELIWDKTLYISNGKTSGGFMFEGVVYKDRNNPKPPDIIFQNSVFSKTIYPNNLIFFARGSYGGWRHQNMSAGENGIYLTLKIEGVEMHEKITTNLTASKK